MYKFNPSLLSALRCPHCIQRLFRREATAEGRLTLYGNMWLVAQECGRKYPLEDGIPLMLVDEGEKWMDTPVEDLPESRGYDSHGTDTLS